MSQRILLSIFLLAGCAQIQSPEQVSFSVKSWDTGGQTNSISQTAPEWDAGDSPNSIEQSTQSVDNKSGPNTAPQKK